MEEPTDTLLPATEDFLRNTPGLPYPQALTSRFPRIANQLVSAKDDAAQLKDVFNQLTHDHRGGRHGFPFDVLMDIHNLREVLLGDQVGFELTDENKWVS